MLALGGCATGNHPVEWQREAPLDYARPLQVSVVTRVPMPRAELSYIRSDIVARLTPLFRGADLQAKPYQLEVVITRYDEGDAFARFWLAGLGTIELHGVVRVTSAGSVVRHGTFEKSYALGGIVGASAGMHEDVASKLGTAIAEALAPQGEE
jgi:hypothetical protein